MGLDIHVYHVDEVDVIRGLEEKIAMMDDRLSEKQEEIEDTVKDKYTYVVDKIVKELKDRELVFNEDKVFDKVMDVVMYDVIYRSIEIDIRTYMEIMLLSQYPLFMDNVDGIEEIIDMFICEVEVVLQDEDVKRLKKELLELEVERAKLEEEENELIDEPVIILHRYNMLLGWLIEHDMYYMEESADLYLDRDTVENILKDVGDAIEAYERGEVNKCKELMPAVKGFFFGSTEYDDGYLDKLKRLSKVLIEFLTADKKYMMLYVWY